MNDFDEYTPASLQRPKPAFEPRRPDAPDLDAMLESIEKGLVDLGERVMRIRPEALVQAWHDAFGTPAAERSDPQFMSDAETIIARAGPNPTAETLAVTMWGFNIEQLIPSEPWLKGDLWAEWPLTSTKAGLSPQNIALAEKLLWIAEKVVGK